MFILTIKYFKVDLFIIIIIYIYIAQYPADTACSTRLYYVYDIMYRTIIHDDIVYSLKSWVLPLI